MKDLIDKFVNNADIDAISTDSTERVETLEQKIGLRFPRSFRVFLCSYDFDPFEFGGIEFFANAGGSGDRDLTVAIFRDSCLSVKLIENGLLQIGQPDTGDYDPICFNTRTRRGDECEIVRVDHEGILCRDQIVISCVIAESFPKLIEK